MRIEILDAHGAVENIILADEQFAEQHYLGRYRIAPEAYPPPLPDFVPVEVPRWAGLLALKRHVLDSGDLVLLAAGDARPDDNLLAGVLSYRSTLPAGELADRLDAALNDAKDWRIDSPTVSHVAQIFPLTGEHLEQLFRWAGAQVETL